MVKLWHIIDFSPFYTEKVVTVMCFNYVERSMFNPDSDLDPHVSIYSMQTESQPILNSIL